MKVGRFLLKKFPGLHLQVRAHSMGGLVFAAAVVAEEGWKSSHPPVVTAIFYDCPFEGVDFNEIMKNANFLGTEKIESGGYVGLAGAILLVAGGRSQNTTSSLQIENIPLLRILRILWPFFAKQSQHLLT
jgi:hypothetical protein